MDDAASLRQMALEQDQHISEVVKREQFRLRNFIRRHVPDPQDAEDPGRPGVEVRHMASPNLRGRIAVTRRA